MRSRHKDDEKEMKSMGLIEEFYACPSCGRAIVSEKRRFFVCHNCGQAICEESKIMECSDKYCGVCGADIREEKIKALKSPDTWAKQRRRYENNGK